MTMNKSIRLILGDQLSFNISSLVGCDKENDLVFMCEVWEEATYVKHHKKKIAFLFSAMRHFADELRSQGYQVRYTTLDDPMNAGSFHGEVKGAIASFKPDSVIVTAPAEYRVLEDMRHWHQSLSIDIDIRPDNRFLCTPEEFAEWASGRKTLRMEFFYREMRKKYNILMSGQSPEGGEWNYDIHNRNPCKQNSLFIPQPKTFEQDQITRDVIKLVTEKFPDHFGDLEPFYFAVTRRDALIVLDYFIRERLPLFGEFQDVMIEGQPWMYHAHISFYLNCGLLDPLEVVQRAEQAYRARQAPLNAVEGFIRQIIGWREYIRGIYWLRMPDYKQENFLNATRNLPEFYWTGKTEMNCMKQCITETRQNAYAHHIQRLMVLGNFALLAGIDPEQVNEWYLIVYADAYEWVELPNVSGMILFADGGYLASKPYAASGAYINKMSDYCKNCRFDVNEKSGPNACPFNYLYWNFMIENKDKLERNPRLGLTYASLKNMRQDKISQIVSDSRIFLESIQ